MTSREYTRYSEVGEGGGRGGVRERRLIARTGAATKDPLQSSEPTPPRWYGSDHAMQTRVVD
jgi:hypothetical protein